MEIRLGKTIDLNFYHVKYSEAGLARCGFRQFQRTIRTVSVPNIVLWKKESKHKSSKSSLDVECNKQNP